VKKISVSLLATLSALLLGCETSTTNNYYSQTTVEPPPASVSADAGGEPATAATTDSGTASAADTGSVVAIDTQPQVTTVTAISTATQTTTATVTTRATVPFSILSVEVDKVDALGNPAEDVRSFGIRFNEPAMDVELTVMSISDSDFGHIVHHEYIAHSPESLYISPGNWSEKLKSNTTYQWVIRANADITVMSGLGSTANVTGNFTTALCFVGETRHCYDGPAGTDGVGRCHGATQECVPMSTGFQWDAACPLGEVLPYQYGDIVGNGIDDDCNGIVDDGEAYFCPVNDSTISQGCCMPSGSSFSRPSLSDLTHQPNAYILVKGSNSFVYLYATNDKRYVFTNEDVITSWFTSFDGGQLGDLQNVCNTVNELSDVELASITIGGNVTIRPGSDIVKIASDPALYVVARGKVLRKLATADLAEKIYPGSSAQRTRVIPEAFFVNYSIGLDVSNASDYDPAAEWAAADMETEAESPVVP